MLIRYSQHIYTSIPKTASKRGPYCPPPWKRAREKISIIMIYFPESSFSPAQNGTKPTINRLSLTGKHPFIHHHHHYLLFALSLPSSNTLNFPRGSTPGRNHRANDSFLLCNHDCLRIRVVVPGPKVISEFFLEFFASFFTLVLELLLERRKKNFFPPSHAHNPPLTLFRTLSVIYRWA